jgi:transcriptional regulator with XRE-family HTH domain
VTQSPFPEELPRLLKARNESLRGLAREVGGIDHAYLSRMVRREAAVNPRHVARIAAHLGLPDDYFPEVREAAVVQAIRRDAELRDAIYFDRVRKLRRPPRAN